MRIASEIKDTAKVKFPRTEWIRDGVESIMLTSSWSAQASADPLLESRVAAGLRGMGYPGFLEWSVGSAGDKTSVWTRAAGVETRSSGAIDGTSGLPQLSILE